MSPCSLLCRTVFIKQQCQEDLVNAVNAVAVESNKFVRELSWFITLGLGTLLIIGLARLGLEVQNRMQERGVPLQEAKQPADPISIDAAHCLCLPMVLGSRTHQAVDLEIR